jgi:Ser/Thr protein kinase RdoA (MazF antagonist)
VDPQVFDELLARYGAGVQPQSGLESLGGAGGLSGARLWRFQSRDGDFVLRAWPPDGPGPEHLKRVHRWLFLTEDMGFTPVPVRDLMGRSLQDFEGAQWEITPWLKGQADAANPPAPAHLRAAFVGLAAFHQKLACEETEGVSPGLGLRTEAVTQLVAGGLDRLEIAIQRRPGSPKSLSAAALRWLTLARTVAPRILDSLKKASALVVRIQPCLRDARPEHFLFEGDNLTGIVDFGAMGIDTVSGDLSRLVGEWLDGDSTTRSRAFEAYGGGRPLEPAELTLIGVFESSADLLIGERWVRWHYLENRRFDDPQAVGNGLGRGLRRLERLASRLAHDSLVK